MRFLPFLLALSVAVPAFAQTAAMAQQWVKEAEKLQDDDPAAGLRLLERALPLLPLAAQPNVRMDARRAQCWSTAIVDGSKVPPVVAAALEEARSINHLVAIADLELCRGYAFETTGKVNEAAADYELAVRDGARSGDQKVWADALVLRGEMFYYRGQFTAAIDDLQKAYAMNVALKRESKQRYALNAIANLYADRRVGAYDRAIEYYRQLLAASTKKGTIREMATARFNIAATLETKGELQAALDEYQRALKLEQQRKDPGAIADVQRPLGVVLGKLGRLDEALAMLDAALARFRQTKDEESSAQTQMARGVVLRKLGRTREALAELDAARSQFIQTRSDRFLERTEEERALALTALGDFAARSTPAHRSWTSARSSPNSRATSTSRGCACSSRRRRRSARTPCCCARTSSGSARTPSCRARTPSGPARWTTPRASGDCRPSPSPSAASSSGCWSTSSSATSPPPAACATSH
jgi:tetratricopeptide (TPR) repeat protein